MTGRTLFVGDVHGCASELEALLALSNFRSGADRLWLTGDAFSRGPDPRAVWELIVSHGAGMVLGNHDDRLLRQLRARSAGQALTFRHDQARTFEALLPVAEALLPWLEGLPLYVDRPDFLLVHAGIHPLEGLAGTRREEFLAIRTWPPMKGSLEGPRWHDVIDPERMAGRTLVFGHDAPGGLVVKRLAPGQRPWLVGLDSGCVYGGALSGWWLEADRLVQVESRQPEI